MNKDLMGRMRSLAMYQVDAFADHVFGGNPAAVLVLDEWLTHAMMQNIAAENNLAETAFVRASAAGWDLRWFTPLHEVDFCGHATLATAHVLATERRVQGELVFATRVGELRVSRQEDGYTLDVPSLPPRPIDDFPSALSAMFPNAGATLIPSPKCEQPRSRFAKRGDYNHNDPRNGSAIAYRPAFPASRYIRYAWGSQRVVHSNETRRAQILASSRQGGRRSRGRGAPTEARSAVIREPIRLVAPENGRALHDPFAGRAGDRKRGSIDDRGGRGDGRDLGLCSD